MKKTMILMVILTTWLVSAMMCQFDRVYASHHLYADESITMISKNPAVIHGMDAFVYTFDVDCHGIPTRQVTVNAFKQSDSKGAVVLTTGGTGGNFYSARSGEALETVRLLFRDGYEVYEVRWDGEMGWGTNARGRGFHVAVGGFTELVRYMFHHLFDNNDKVIAHGNSGGAFQIAYGLAIYDLDEVLDMVILTGGPPTSDLKAGIFGHEDFPERWRAGAGGRRLTDYMMGWDGEGDYCAKGEAPDHIKNQLDTVSLVTDLQPRRYHYNTFVNFVQSDDPTKAHDQARIYYEVITSGKSYYYLPEVTSHNVPGSLEGARIIRQLIMDF